MCWVYGGVRARNSDRFVFFTLDQHKPYIRSDSQDINLQTHTHTHTHPATISQNQVLLFRRVLHKTETCSFDNLLKHYIRGFHKLT